MNERTIVAIALIVAGRLEVTQNEDSVQIIKDGRQLSQYERKRKRCTVGDQCVKICHEGSKYTWAVSHLCWMFFTRSPIPDGFQIHHVDEDCTNNLFDNLICIHERDHDKLHHTITTDTPF